VPTVLAGATRDKNADLIRALDPENPLYKDGSQAYDPTPVAHLRYFIWEAAVDGSWVRQLTGTPQDKLETWEGRQTSLIEDADPCYLPDGGFAFNSTRCQSFGRCHWGRYTPAFLIFRADGDGSNIRQLSFGEANEWEPAGLNDGRLVYTRWDYINRNAVWYQSLWTMRPEWNGNSTSTELHQAPGRADRAQPIPARTSWPRRRRAPLFPRRLAAAHRHAQGEDGAAPPRNALAHAAHAEVVGPSRRAGSSGCYAAPLPVIDTLFVASFSGESLDKPKSENTSWNAYAHGRRTRRSALLVDTLGGRELIYQTRDRTFTPIPVRQAPASAGDPLGAAAGGPAPDNWRVLCRKRLRLPEAAAKGP
jgi:hypothetical protein